MWFHRAWRTRPWKLVEMEWVGHTFTRPQPLPEIWGDQYVKKFNVDVDVVFPHLTDATGLEEYPKLFAFLSEAQYEGAEPAEREPGTMYIYGRHGMVKCTLKEPSQGLRCEVEARSWAELLLAIEVALSDETGKMWSKDTYAKPLKNGKKPKA